MTSSVVARAVPGIDGEHIHCRPLFIVDRHSVPTPTHQAPYYLVSCGEIVNIFPAYAFDDVLDLRLKGAATRTFSTLSQAASAAVSFCGKHHPAREHASSLLYRRPLTTFMEDFPIILRTSRDNWDEGLSFTPLSGDLFSPPLHLEHRSTQLSVNPAPPLLESSSDSDDEIQIIRHCINLLTPPLLEDAAANAQIRDGVVDAVDPTLEAAAHGNETNTQGNAAVNEAPIFYLIRLETDRSYLFKDVRAASRVLREWNRDEGSYGDFIVSNGVFQSPDSLLRDGAILENNYYFAVRGHANDGHSVFSSARPAQAFFEEQCRLQPLSSMMITPHYMLAGEWAFEITQDSDGDE
ncbi:hypothetical protein EYR40_000065 [Pleurotus pulmonarius]|nr:hypothetical protein EYR36_002310 [Pleurotus pulmonarius]KAF4579759.1 hypothetical protein EYR36_001578 [Pleurotus pulmonarius]KAF4583707.1 hypothetical protein EYR40_002198 [Pleurotus pulmonarius]KAF4607730.1 hypothetical protein EYR40_000065 [Pleurotus pulmonarius]